MRNKVVIHNETDSVMRAWSSKAAVRGRLGIEPVLLASIVVRIVPQLGLECRIFLLYVSVYVA